MELININLKIYGFTLFRMKQLLEKFVLYNMELTRSFDRRFPIFTSRESFIDILQSTIHSLIAQNKFSHILEVGGTDRPLLKRSEKFEYDCIDIEHKGSCEELYDHFFIQSIEEPIPKSYDMIFSISLLEHVKNNTLSFTQMYKALNKKGYIVHYTPSKLHPYSMILRSIGVNLQRKLIRALRPWAKDTTGYPAYFDKCSPGELKKVTQNLGFQQIEITPFYRANNYFRFFLPAYILVTLWENICKRFNWKLLCSGFIIIARKY